MLPTSAQMLRRQLLTSRWTSVPDSILHRTRFLHATSAGQSPRKKNFFSSNANLKLEEASTKSEIAQAASQAQKRKAVRSPPGKRSLRRVAAEAQRSQENHTYRRDTAVSGAYSEKFITAICAAEEYDMGAVVGILRSHGFPIDPDGTDFLEEMVVHTRGVNDGDIFIFPSGTMVSWSLPEDVAKNIATTILKPAAVKPYDPSRLEMEDLEYREDSNRENSSIKGDVVTLGTKAKPDPQAAGASATISTAPESHQPARLPTTLAKIAFSSGLARSTKLAVLETMLSTYITSTRSIPQHFTQSSLTGLPFSRAYIRSKTGELLEIRAQLNHYSELTDSLPDLFWDASHDLGLEGYYDQVGKALDVGIRIRTLNEKMDYAQEIASILRETLSHSHSSKLEWIIIALIAVEIVMGLLREWRERKREEAVAAAEGRGNLMLP